ncbi:MAG: glycosyltransferase family 39 protein [Acidobacteria bacterium]|nr:glycosyltransferase family 39 protein [Acidobacteriota bacterium]
MRINRKPAAFALAVVAVALCVRLLTWQETRLEVGKVQTVVTAGYRRDARLLLDGGVRSFFSRASPLANPDSLGHPPGYPFLLALLANTVGDADARVQLFQIACDALACALLFLVVAELVNLSTALVAGLLAAVSPQLAWNSVLLLPDSLSALPVLLAVYCLALSAKRPRVALLIAAGALVGVSCWLRANALLLAPFLAVFALLLFERARRLRLAASLLAGALVVVGVLTLRNAVVFRHFVPVSLGAGQTLLEGIGDYDTAGRFGVPSTDDEIMRQEAEAARRPDYNDTLLGADGIARERLRLRCGFAVIRSHPFWFASVVLQRAASMLRMERARRVSISPPDDGGDTPGAPSSFSRLTLPARAVVAPLQRLFITALVLPLVLGGFLILAREPRRRRALALLCAVPAYYFCVQSIFHTEYRYTLAANYFYFALAAVALTAIGAALSRLARARATRAGT